MATATVATVSGMHKAIGTWQHRVDRYLAVSQYVADVMAKEGLPPQKIAVKPCFSFQHTPSLPSESAARKDVLFVGRLSQEKGLSVLLDAWRRIQPTRARLKIIGEGALPDDLPDNVDVLGKKTPTEVQQEMSKAAFVVMPGLWAEPFGRVAVEAFSQGAPVIASGIGGVADIIEHGVTGALFERGNARSLSRHLSDFIENPDRTRALGRAAYQSYLLRYTPAANLRHLEEAYTEVTKGRQTENSAQGDVGQPQLSGQN